ncbi:MAG: acyl carrier protein [Selenomonadaceae bacterium]|nr:acyl carrier protein [Selenomonadaceae bacterium]
MTEIQILDILQVIFRDVFDDETIVITNESNAAQIEEWDSLSQIRLVMMIEKKFGIKFSYGELNHLKNVGEILQVIKEKL